MRKFKRLLSGLVCTGMILGSVSTGFATGEIGMGNITDEVVYQVSDMTTGELITTYQSDIDMGHWNVEALGEDSPHIFEEFPVKISSSVDYYGNLSISFLYLKKGQEATTAVFEAKDKQSGETYYSADLTENPKAVLENIPMDKVFDITLTENFGGDDVVYSRVLTTKNKRASMPLNVDITGVSSVEGVLAESVTIVELDINDEETFIDEDGIEQTIVKKRESNTMLPNELPEYYNELPENKMYKVFATAGSEAAGKTYDGFISTYPGGAEQGIYEPSFTTYTQERYEELLNQPQMASLYSINGSSPNGYTESDITTNSNAYNQMDDRSITTSHYTDFFVVSFMIPETTPYSVEVISNEYVEMEIWLEETEGDVNYLDYENGNAGLTYTFESLPARCYYFAISMPEVNDGSAIFRIKATEYGDQGNSYYDYVEDTNTDDAENLTGVWHANDLVTYDTINYRGDVDVYRLDNRADNGIFYITVTNAPKTTGANPRSDCDIKMLIKRQGNGIGGGIVMVTEMEKTITTGSTKGYTFFTESGYNYYIYFYSASDLNNLSVSDAYNFEILNPSFGDTYEPNNTMATATQLNPTGEQFFDDVTIHKGDVDYYKFTTTAAGMEFYADVFKTMNALYNLSLYKEVSSNSTTLIAEGTASGSHNTIEMLLEPNTTYYIKVDGIDVGALDGTDDAYHPNGYYDFDFYPTEPSITATMTGSAAFNYTVGDTVDINEYISTVASKLSCTVNNTAVASSEIAKDVKLYYTSGTTKTELTASNIATMSAGNYTLTAEYRGEEVTGGTITLTVEEAISGDIVELSTVIMETTPNPNWYWAACAKMIADSRLRREGGTPTSTTLAAGIMAAHGSSMLTSVGDIAQTAQLASYFYCGNKDSFNFIESTVSINGFETGMLSALNAGQAVIALLENTATATKKYIVIYGINTGTHQYKIMDPEGSVNTWITADELYSGYGGNTGLTFTGQVIECL